MISENQRKEIICGGPRDLRETQENICGGLRNQREPKTESAVNLRNQRELKNRTNMKLFTRSFLLLLGVLAAISPSFSQSEDNGSEVESFMRALQRECSVTFREADNSRLANHLSAYFDKKEESPMKFIYQRDLSEDSDLVAVEEILSSYGCSLVNFAVNYVQKDSSKTNSMIRQLLEEEQAKFEKERTKEEEVAEPFLEPGTKAVLRSSFSQERMEESKAEVQPLIQALSGECAATFKEKDSSLLANHLSAYFNKKEEGTLKLIYTSDLFEDPDLVRAEKILSGYGCSLRPFAVDITAALPTGTDETLASLEEEMMREMEERIQAEQDSVLQNLMKQAEEKATPKQAVPAQSLGLRTLAATAAALPTQAEYDALIALYNATDGPNWTNNTGWVDADPEVIEDVSGWHGITTNEDGSVQQIRLGNNNLVGFIPAALDNLTELKSLSLYQNQLSGPIPSELGNLTKLESISLYRNQLSGPIPSKLCDLSSLQLLNLSVTNVSGPIPSKLGDLSSLQRLYLNSTEISGSIPSELGKLSNLRNLILFDTQVSGTIPAQLGNLSNLSYLWLGDNNQLSQLSGPIPPELGNLSNLEVLFLQNTQLSGIIPPELASSLNLTHFSSSQFTFSSFLELKQNFTGSSFSYAPQGTIDSERTIEVIATNTLTLTTDIDRNTDPPCKYQWYKGGVPISTFSIDNHTITIENSDFDDEGIYHYIIQNDDAPDLTLTSREITVNVTGPSRAEYDALMALYNATDGPNWKNNNGWKDADPDVIEDVSGWYGVYTNANGNVTSLLLDENKLNGYLPTELSNLENLAQLELFRNPQLSGPIPATLGNLSNLMSLRLQFTKISGPIPPEIGNLSKLRTFWAFGAELSGPIPPEIGNLSELTGLWIFGNELYGLIPPKLATNLQVILIDDNQFTFSDFLELKQNFSGYIQYFSQDSIDSTKTIKALKGNTLTLTTDIDRNTDPPCKYQWYKDGVAFSTLSTENHTITIENTTFDDAGIYHYIIQNDDAPDLTLTSRNITVDVIVLPTQAEYDALMALYNATDGPNWKNNTGWRDADPDVIEDVSGWYGVTTTENGNVLGLFLRNNNLEGYLPSELGDLVNLVNLDLAENQLRDSIPVEIGNLTNLGSLLLFYNPQLGGPIPSELGNLANLRNLQLHATNLSGSIPPELGNLSKLEQLWLFDTELSGPIPRELGNLGNLGSLVLFGNQHSGVVPLELATNTRLGAILLENNQFTFSSFLEFKQNFTGGFFTYVPQDSIDSTKAIKALKGKTLTLTADIDRNTDPPCKYQWYKDGVAISSLGTENHTLTIQNSTLDDAGIYHYLIKNDDAPGLTLTSRKITVEVTECELEPEFTFFPHSCGTQFVPVFENEYDCDIISYDWDFGDGTTSAKAEPFHDYGTAGVFEVKLKLTYECPGDCGMRTDSASHSVDVTEDVLEQNQTVNVATNIIDDVLSASASSFSDSWMVKYDNEALSGNHPFLNGSRGVWRNDASFVYQKDRNVSEQTNVGQDGTFQLESFNWAYAQYNAVPGWLKVNNVTQYSPYSYEVENRDVLDNYSSALYGYGGHLPVAVGQNMGQSEMAYTGFEELNSSGFAIVDDASQKGSGNWTVSIGATREKLSSFEVVQGIGNLALINAPIETFNDIDTVGILARIRRRGRLFNRSRTVFDVAILCREPYGASNEKTRLAFDQVIDLDIWSGYMWYYQPSKNGTPADISETVAHTGTKSLRTTSPKTIRQGHIQLVPGKEYRLSAWLSVNDKYLYEPVLGEDLGIRLRFYNEEDVQVGWEFLQPGGSLIEGWQKLEDSFICPEGTSYFTMEFDPGTASAVYFDDLRLFPEEGNMQSYVYELDTYRLKAVLDENNYASLYYYDAEGNLYLVKKETERGIRAIQESVSYQKENDVD